MHDVAAVAVEDRGEVVKRAVDVDVADVDVPVFVRLLRLMEARPFLRGLLPLTADRPAAFSTRYTLDGLTATTSRSSIMNASRR